MENNLRNMKWPKIYWINEIDEVPPDIKKGEMCLVPSGEEDDDGESLYDVYVFDGEQLVLLKKILEDETKEGESQCTQES